MVSATPTAPPDDEKLLSVPAAVEAETGYRPTPSTAWRWTKKGVGGIKLETVIFGGRPATKRVWVREFIAATSAARS